MVSLFLRTMDQDWVDLANGFWSVLLLAVCSLGAFLTRYVTKPISCWTPAQFTRSHVQYTENTCFMKEKYYQPFPYAKHMKVQERTLELSTHLWIPLILFFQAVCFMAPRIIWKLCRSSLTINMAETVTSLEEAQVEPADNGQAVFKNTARIMSSLLRRNKFLLAVFYLIVKLLYCLNLVGQFVFLTIYFNGSLAMKAGEYVGVNTMSYIRPSLQKNVFCEYSIRNMATVQKYALQCSLPISEVYEKLFVFLWYWVFFLAVITVLNLLLWAGFLFLPFLRDSRISAHISAFSPTPGSPPDTATLRRFVSGFLGIDGVFVLSMISQNSSELVAADLTHQLYQVFQENQPPVVMQPVESGAEATGTFSNANAPPVSEKPPTV